MPKKKKRNTRKKRDIRPMYGANEKPRSCPLCKSVKSCVVNTYHYSTPDRIVRRRKCTCGQIWVSMEVTDSAYIN